MIEFLDLPDPPCFLNIESIKLKKMIGKEIKKYMDFMIVKMN